MSRIVGAFAPGRQITPTGARAHDIDFSRRWERLAMRASINPMRCSFPCLLAVGLSFFGCPPAPAAPDGGTAIALCRQYAVAFCAREQRCGREAESTVGFCEERTAQGCMAYGGRFVESGAAVIDLDAGTTCVAMLPTRTDCADARCSPFIIGGGLGQPCAFESTCREGFCRGGAPNTCAACAPFAALGQLCSPSERCADDAFCDPSTSRCASRKPAGAACTTPGMQTECEGYSPCVATDAGARCAPFADGQPCTNLTMCGRGSFCEVMNPTTGEGACSPQRPAGAACDQSSAFPCREGTACIEGTCVALGSRDAGEGCLDSETCLAGLVCAPDPAVANRGVCQRRGQQGERCIGDGCAAGLVCACRQVPCVEFTCQPRAGIGGECPCFGGLICRYSSDGGASRCEAPPQLGEPCQSFDECLPPQTCSASGRCVAPGGAGTPCRASFDCESFACRADGGCGARCF